MRSLLQGAPLPSRLLVLLEGESLLNDAAGLVLYRFAVTATLTGTFDAGSSAISFAGVAAGGVVTGIVVGVAAVAVFSRLPQERLTVVGSFLVAWAAYIGAERLHVSGVLSTVVCGLVLSRRQHARMPATVRIQMRAVWDAAVFVLESLVFILIGLSLRGVLHRFGGSPEALLVELPGIAVIVAAVVASRFAWIMPAAYIEHRLVPRLLRRDAYLPFGVPLVMSWAGMRGVVSLAAALALPVGFTARDFILVSAFAVILVTVLVQGITLGPLIRSVGRHGIVLSDHATLPEAEVRARVSGAQLRAVEQAIRAVGTHQSHADLIARYARQGRTAAGLASPPALGDHVDMVLAAVAAGRAELIRLHRLGRIQDPVLRAIERELDFEEVGARLSSPKHAERSPSVFG